MKVSVCFASIVIVAVFLLGGLAARSSGDSTSEASSQDLVKKASGVFENPFVLLDNLDQDENESVKTQWGHVDDNGEFVVKRTNLYSHSVACYDGDKHYLEIFLAGKGKEHRLDLKMYTPYAPTPFRQTWDWNTDETCVVPENVKKDAVEVK